MRTTAVQLVAGNFEGFVLIVLRLPQRHPSTPKFLWNSDMANLDRRTKRK